MFQKALVLFLVSTVKFMFAFPLAVTFNFSFLNTFIITTAGGIFGVIFFAFLSQGLIAGWRWFLNRYVYPRPAIARRLRFLTGDPAEKKKPVSMKKKRRYIRLRKSVGFWGIAMLTPSFISIPIGTFLIVRFYGRSLKNILLVCVLVVVWSAFFSSLVHFAGVTY